MGLVVAEVQQLSECLHITVLHRLMDMLHLLLKHHARTVTATSKLPDLFTSILAWELSLKQMAQTTEKQGAGGGGGEGVSKPTPEKQGASVCVCVGGGGLKSPHLKSRKQARWGGGGGSFKTPCLKSRSE